MIGLLLSAMLLCYIDRIIISLAAIEMQREFDWTDSQKGQVLSAFFLGYLLTQIGGGFLSNRFGGRNVFLWAVLLWSIFTVLTPIAAGISFTVLIAVRVMLGVGDGASFPSAYNLIHRWMPVQERSRAVGSLNTAAAVGTVVTLLSGGLLIESFGWPAVFYLFGLHRIFVVRYSGFEKSRRCPQKAKMNGMPATRPSGHPYPGVCF